MKRKLEAWGVLIAAAVGAFSVGFIPTAAKAATPTPSPEPSPYCSTWKMRGATGQYPEVVFGGVPDGAGFTANKATLVKPSEGVMPGVEFATFNVDIDLGTPQTLTVDYQLVGGASHAAGAVRMFYYTEADADTLNDAPTAFVAADTFSGTLTIPNVEVIKTLGLVYDGSNPAQGSVIFENMKLGDMPIKFRPVGCPSPSPSPSVTTPAPTNSPTPNVTASPKTTPSPVGLLPVTGTSGGDRTPFIIGAGVVLIVAGGLSLFMLRTRKARVEVPKDDL